MRGWSHIWGVPGNEAGQIDLRQGLGRGEANGPMRRTRLPLRAWITTSMHKARAQRGSLFLTLAVFLSTYGSLPLLRRSLSSCLTNR